MFPVFHHFRTVLLTANFAAHGALASGTAARANIVSDFSGACSFGSKYRRPFTGPVGRPAAANQSYRR